MIDNNNNNNNNNYLLMVKEFHKTFQAPVLESPQIPGNDRCELRLNLMQEELDEIKTSIENNDIVEVCDGMCDLMYVLCGSIHEFGIGNKFNELFKEVQRSNMSKSCNSVKEANETISYYKEKDGTEGYYEEVNGKWVVYRRGDNKVLKSINYSPVDFKPILKS